MKTTENYLAEIKEIRKMMEESSRFLSLSGLSGVLAGIYALIGAFIANSLIFSHKLFGKLLDSNILTSLLLLATVVLSLSIFTIIILTIRKAKKAGKKFWNAGSRLMLLNLSVPLVAGGILILIFVFRGVYEIVAPGCLIFYGLALVNAAKFTRQEIFYMGLFQLLLGLLAALLPAYAILFWALGFGAIHIIYGTVMYFRYEYKTKE